MSTKAKPRPLSASRKRRRQQRSRRHSLNDNQTAIDSEYTFNGAPIEPNTIYSEIDFRSPKEIIQSLEKEIIERKNNCTFEEQLNSLVLIQLYTYLEYGEYSIENIRAYFNLSKFYFDQKNMIRQATSHILTARQILVKMYLKPNKDHLVENLLGFDVYLLSLQCLINAKNGSIKRDLRTKTKQTEKKKEIDDHLDIIEEYLVNLKELMSIQDYESKYSQVLFVKFDLIITNIDEWNSKIVDIIEDILIILEKYSLENLIKQKIDIYLRYSFYLTNFNDKIDPALEYYKKAAQLAEHDEDQQPSDEHKYQLANALFQWAKARVRINRLTDNTERKFLRSIELHRKVNSENDKIILKIIDELATFYTKTKRYQDALNILCDSLSDKKRLFGEFSDEVIETESRIGAIYLCECEYLNAAEHLKECLTLQEFVYGLQNPRTRQTRDALELLKKDPQVFRALFSRPQDQARPAFKLSNKISYDKDDHQLLTTKPPITPKN